MLLAHAGELSHLFAGVVKCSLKGLELGGCRRRVGHRSFPFGGLLFYPITRFTRAAPVAYAAVIRRMLARLRIILAASSRAHMLISVTQGAFSMTPGR